MTPSARTGYAQAKTPIRTDRGTEYAVFAQATRRLSAVDEADKSQFPALAEAIVGNQQLWSALAEDLIDEANQLPLPLRGQLLSLSEFVRRHSMQVLAGRASVAPLVDINTAIMKGLRGEVEEAA
jgi:flagellar biosynthesis activator protein FlaF